MRVLLVGGSGGLGKPTAELLSREGWEVFVSFYRNTTRAAELRRVATLLQADITLAADRARLLEEVGSIDGLAVFTGDPSRVSQPDQLEQQMESSHAINYMAPLLLAREAAEKMKQSAIPGAIVLFSTMQATALFPGSTAYAGAKAALIHGARILAKEVRAHNIRVNVIAPGIINAGMAEASIVSGKYSRYLADNVITRYGDPRDVARTVRFLLEPDSYITGQVIGVDGGITL